MGLESEVIYLKPKGDILVILSVIATIMAAIVFFGRQDIFSLAGTQWILIAILLGIYGIYAKIRN